MEGQEKQFSSGNKEILGDEGNVQKIVCGCEATCHDRIINS